MQITILLLVTLTAYCLAATVKSSSKGARADDEGTAVAVAEPEVPAVTPAGPSISDLIASIAENNNMINRLIHYLTVVLRRVLRMMFGDNIPLLGNTDDVVTNAAAAASAVARATRHLTASHPAKYEYKVEQIR